MRRPVDELPARLIEGEGPAAELVRRFTRQPPHAPGENAAWDGTLARLGRDAGSHRGRLVFALVVGAMTGAAALYLALVPHPRFFAAASRTPAGAAPVAVPAPAAALANGPAPSAAPGSIPARVLAAKTQDAPATDAPHIQLGRAAVGLPVGAAELVGEADVTLSRDGAARAFTTARAATVELATGALDLHVEKRHAEDGHSFEVQAGPYRFTVLGTVFRVSRTAGDVTLSVTEGRVAVSRGDAALAIITAGGFWSGAAGSATAPPPRRSDAAPTGRVTARAPAPAREAVTAPAPQAAGSAGAACAAREAAGDAAGAADCFAAAATGTDLGAEVALYQAARLYRDALGQPERAVATLQEARRRFPAGALSAEVELSLAELLPRLGRYREALDATQAVLDRHPAPARAGELHLLRGDVLRAGLASCAAAEAEYEAASRAGDDRVADFASFWRAACLEAEGRPEARAAFALYLTRPHPSRAAEARRRLRALETGPP